MDRHHIIRQQRVRQFVTTQTGDRELADLAVSDPRNIVNCCRFHHDLITNARIIQPIPPATWEFARDWGLSWALERDTERGLAA